MLDTQRLEVQDQLAMADRMREAQLSLMSRVRLAREAARHTQAEADARSQACHRQLAADAQQFSHECAEWTSELRRQHERQFRQQQEALLRERAQLQHTVSEQDRERQESLLAKERARFKERLGQLLQEDRAQVQEEQDQLRQEIDRLQRARMESEQERACLERRRKLAEQRELELSCSLEDSLEEPLPKEERRRLRKKLTEHVPRPRVLPRPGHLSTTPSVKSDSEASMTPPVRLGRAAIIAAAAEDSDASSYEALGAAGSSGSSSVGTGRSSRRRASSSSCVCVQRWAGSSGVRGRLRA